LAIVDKKIKSFVDLEAWQIAHKFALEIYRLTKGFPKEELYGIVSQLRRAALSITSNIAEGFSRYHYNDKIRFYYNSRGSISEIKNCLILSRDLKYITDDICGELLDFAERILRLINGLIRSIENQK
jgi:four helix bundle protein